MVLVELGDGGMDFADLVQLLGALPGEMEVPRPSAELLILLVPVPRATSGPFQPQLGA